MTSLNFIEIFLKGAPIWLIAASRLTILQRTKVLLKFGLKPLDKKKIKEKGFVVWTHDQGREAIAVIVSFVTITALQITFLPCHFTLMINSATWFSCVNVNWLLGFYGRTQVWFKWVCVRARARVWETLCHLTISCINFDASWSAWPLAAAVRVVQIVPWTGRHSD